MVPEQFIFCDMYTFFKYIISEFLSQNNINVEFFYCLLSCMVLVTLKYLWYYSPSTIDHFILNLLCKLLFDCL